MEKLWTAVKVIVIFVLVGVVMMKVRGMWVTGERFPAAAGEETVEVVVSLASPSVCEEAEYRPARLSELPQRVKSLVVTRYAAYCIDEVYKGAGQSYKMVLKNGTAKMVVYYSASGELLKKEVVKTPPIVAFL